MERYARPGAGRGASGSVAQHCDGANTTLHHMSWLRRELAKLSSVRTPQPPFSPMAEAAASSRSLSKPAGKNPPKLPSTGDVRRLAPSHAIDGR